MARASAHCRSWPHIQLPWLAAMLMLAAPGVLLAACLSAGKVPEVAAAALGAVIP